MLFLEKAYNIKLPSKMFTIINQNLLDNLSQQAAGNERKRMNFNLHPSLDAPVQRLLNALEPETVIPIHRHTNTDEVYILLSGSINVLLYNDQKEIQKIIHLDPAKGNYGIQIPAGQWHGIEVLANNSVIFEVKQGPYQPLSNADILH